MDGARWTRVQALFHEAADLPRDRQHTFLNTACGGDESLISDVMAMLDEDSREGSLLDRGLDQVARGVLGDALPASFQEFGPYRIQKVLGEGGMGVVYLAMRDDLGIRVAIKILRDAWLSPARRERFASEQRTLAQLNHPSIARLYDADTLADGTPWFVMEYVDGVPLTDYCRDHNCSIEERLKYFRAVCEAVRHAHEHGVVHRDLKPSNILVKRDGSVRLLDFGIAKQLDPAGAPVDQTRTGMHLMTPAYAAPEQIRGEPAGVPADVYSLGVILYELLAGRLPIDVSHKTAMEAASMLVKEEPAKPSAIARHNPNKSAARAASWADLDVLCLTAMHKDLKRRYQSAGALIRDIDHYLKHEPLEARPDTLGYALGKFVRRNWQWVWAAGVMLAMILAAGAVAVSSFRKAPPANPKPRTVAVLPFQNSSSDHSLDHLRLALANEIANTLGYARSLTVRPPEVVNRYASALRIPVANQAVQPLSMPSSEVRKAGRALGVTNIVTGHFLRAGEQLQVTLELIDVETNRLTWRDIFNVPAQNMRVLQAQIAAKTRGLLAPLLGAAEFVAGIPAPPRNEEAYELFLRSSALRTDSAPNREAIGMLERSVALDPDYAPAWGALSSRYGNDSWFSDGGVEAWRRSAAALERAVRLDPNNIALVSGRIMYQVEQGELAEAYREAEDLARRRPDIARIHFFVSIALRYAGLLEESARECDTALLLDAQDAGERSCAVAFLLRGDYQRAGDYLRLDLSSEFEKALSMDILLREGKAKKALAARPATVPQWAGYDMLLAFLERRPAREVAALARTVQPAHDPEVNYFSATHLAYCGQSDAALAMLKRAIEGNYCSYPAMDSDPLLAGLRSKPEFAAIRAAGMACQNDFLARRGK